MKASAWLVVGLAVTAGAANAAMVTSPSAGALQIAMSFDADWNGSLTNTSGAPVEIDSYEIWSVGGRLDPSGWVSIQDVVLSDPLAVVAALGASATGFGELAARPNLLAEGNLSGAAVFQPGTAWGIGRPLLVPPLANDLAFFYTKPGVVGVKFLGRVIPEELAQVTPGPVTPDVPEPPLQVIPEPVTAAGGLVGLVGIIGYLRRRILI